MQNQIFLAILFLIACTSSPQKPAEISTNAAFENVKKDCYTIKKVIDGDTFHANDGHGGIIKVRLIGIDAPESSPTQYEDIEYYGKEAKSYLINRLKDKTVCLTYDTERKDKYKRTLAYVFLEDGTFINEEMLIKGYANVMSIKPNTNHAKDFEKLQTTAKKSKIGMWDGGK